MEYESASQDDLQPPSSSAMPMGSQQQEPQVAAAPAVQAAAPVEPVQEPARARGQWRHDETHMLGIATVTVAAGTAIGMRFGGVYGSLAGGLFGGSVVNVLRAIKLTMQGHPYADREAMLSGTYAVIAAGLGGYIVYAGKKKKGST
jgi:hypothetical protein